MLNCCILFGVKAADLRIPFSWAERKPVLLQKCFYLPPFYHNHEEFSSLAWPSLFGKEGSFPMKVEYCSGNGDWIVEKAQEEPETLWVAVEKRFDRAKKVWARIHRAKLENAIIVCGDALTFTKHYMKEQMVQEIFINFPDPWPKLRHAKHRLLRGSFWEELSRVVVKGGAVVLATDDAEYKQWVEAEIRQVPSWRLERSTNDWPGYGGSWFAELWLSKGREIHYLRYVLD
jgi:tRNA (guanine-N7-)-methyltransferase